ncbi:hypothetical protein PBAL39_12317 [Pedobacter sp. BAL39]|nr:hypothetical protein PBAL39_12317 [Pedobacter sp. BAL39]
MKAAVSLKKSNLVFEQSIPEPGAVEGLKV